MTIKVQHIQASICASTGARIDTLICEYPRAIHAQLLTHRVFSKNSSSTRAIPLENAIDQIVKNPVNFVWTLNQAGMQGELASGAAVEEFEHLFDAARKEAIYSARLLAEAGAHKQNAGRLLEPFQNIKIVLTSTEWENWDWLRNHKDAQGEIAELARAIKKARDEAEPMVLQAGELHVPFVARTRLPTGILCYTIGNSLIEAPTELTDEEALLVSMSVCAQTSYRNSDYSLEKAKVMRGRLLDTDHVHASPSEHQAIAFDKFDVSGRHPTEWNVGITHRDRNCEFWSGNLKGFIQHRQLLKNHDRALAVRGS